MVHNHIDELRERLDQLSDPAGALAGLMELSLHAIALYTPDGRCVRVNPEYDDLFGGAPSPESELAEDEVLGRSGVLFWLRRAFAGETITTPTFWYEHSKTPRPGARRRVALTARAFPLRDPGGAIEMVAITFRDETDTLLLAERRRIEVEAPARLLDEIQRAELERRSTEEQLRAVFEQCAEGLMLTDDDGRVLDINPAGSRIFGRPTQDIVGSRYWDHIGGLANSRPLGTKLMEEGRLYVEVRVQRADGSTSDLELHAVANILPHRHLTTFLDVTERNDALENLRRSETHLLASQRIANVGSWEYVVPPPEEGFGDKPLLCSDECFRLFGIEPGSIPPTPRHLLAAIHPDDRRAGMDTLAKAIDTRSVYSSEYRIRRADGEERTVQARGEILFDADSGRPVRMIGTTQDITERSRARAEIQALNEELESRVTERTAQLEAAKQDHEAFAYCVSHDLRAPLRAINGYAKILMEYDPSRLDEAGIAALARIESAARRMDALIDGLLALSRLGRGESGIREVAVRPIVDEALEEVGIAANGDSVEVVIGPLPDCRADPALLRQVFVNLIGNAAKFSRDRSPARIEISGHDEGGKKTWCVRDNGIGFDVSEAPNIFGIFHRLPTASSYEGFGVGLAIVERIVKRHGGQVWAESAPGKGAAFRFTLEGASPWRA